MTFQFPPAASRLPIPPAALRLPSDQDASGRSFTAAELDLVAAVLASGTLTATKGEQTRSLQNALSELLEVSHVTACSSGTGAIHAAAAVRRTASSNWR